MLCCVHHDTSVLYVIPGGRRGKAAAGLAQARYRVLGAVALRGATAQVRGRGRAFTGGVVGLGALSSCLTAEPPLLRLSVVERTLRLSWQRGWRSAPARPGPRPTAAPAVSQPPRPPAAPGPPPDVLLIVYICFIVRDSQCLLTERSSKGQCINGAQSFSRV